MAPPNARGAWAARLQAVSAQDWIAGGCLALVIALSWLWLFNDEAGMRSAADMAAMPGMAPTGPALFAAYVPPTFVMWLLMMVAMMLPSAAPFVLLYARFARQQGPAGGGWGPVTAFAGAYIGVWAGFSLIAAIAQWALVRSGAVSAMTQALGDHRIAGGLLIAAGLYQLTPLKRACIQACQAPLSFLMRYWRPGWRGALRLGLRHGVYCLGCCWAMMALLFVGGVMSLAWIAGLALLVLIEKLSPAGRELGLAAGVLMTAAGVLLALGVVAIR